MWSLGCTLHLGCVTFRTSLTPLSRGLTQKLSVMHPSWLSKTLLGQDPELSASHPGSPPDFVEEEPWPPPRRGHAGGPSETRR